MNPWYVLAFGPAIALLVRVLMVVVEHRWNEIQRRYRAELDIEQENAALALLSPHTRALLRGEDIPLPPMRYVSQWGEFECPYQVERDVQRIAFYEGLMQSLYGLRSVALSPRRQVGQTSERYQARTKVQS